MAQNYRGDGSKVVTVFSDSNKKYLSTDLMNEEPEKDTYISSHVNFVDYTPVKRLTQIDLMGVWVVATKTWNAKDTGATQRTIQFFVTSVFLCASCVQSPKISVTTNPEF